jgi:hypothetical protein
MSRSNTEQIYSLLRHIFKQIEAEIFGLKQIEAEILVFYRLIFMI